MNKLTEKLRGLRSSRHRGLGFGALTAKSVGRGSSMLIGVQGKPVAGADFVLCNLSFMVDVKRSSCAVRADYDREIAAVRAAMRRRTQIALNLAYGSAMASIGLTIPTIAIASIWLDGPLALGLRSTEMVLLFLSVVVGVLTVVPGRAKPLAGGLHLAIFASFLFLTVSP